MINFINLYLFQCSRQIRKYLITQHLVNTSIQTQEYPKERWVCHQCWKWHQRWTRHGGSTTQNTGWSKESHSVDTWDVGYPTKNQASHQAGYTDDWYQPRWFFFWDVQIICQVWEMVKWDGVRKSPDHGSKNINGVSDVGEHWEDGFDLEAESCMRAVPGSLPCVSIGKKEKLLYMLRIWFDGKRKRLTDVYPIDQTQYVAKKSMEYADSDYNPGQRIILSLHYHLQPPIS